MILEPVEYLFLLFVKYSLLCLQAFIKSLSANFCAAVASLSSQPESALGLSCIVQSLTATAGQ